MTGTRHIQEPKDLREWHAILTFTRSTPYVEVRAYLEDLEKSIQDQIKDVTGDKQQVFVAIGQWQAISGLLAVFDGAREAVEQITALHKQQNLNSGGFNHE